MLVFSPCSECKQRKWATRNSPTDFREKVLHCMECGFEVDLRVAKASRRIVRHDGGQDLQSAESTQGAGE